MKNLLLIVFLFISADGFSQELKPVDLKYSARDSIVTHIENKTIRLYGMAEFKYGNVHFFADEVFINRESRKIIATGLIAYSVPKVIGNINSVHSILTYTMGEDAVLIL